MEAVGPSVGVEHVAAAGAGMMRVPSPVMPVHRHRCRDPFRSRDLDAEPASRLPRGVRRQSSVEPTRQRSHKKSRRTPIRVHVSKRPPIWRPQATNPGHGSPVLSAQAICMADGAGWRPEGARRANFSAVWTSADDYQLGRSPGAIGRPRADSGWPPTAAGGVDGRTDARMGISVAGKGLTTRNNEGKSLLKSVSTRR